MKECYLRPSIYTTFEAQFLAKTLRYLVTTNSNEFGFVTENPSLNLYFRNTIDYSKYFFKELYKDWKIKNHAAEFGNFKVTIKTQFANEIHSATESQPRFSNCISFEIVPDAKYSDFSKHLRRQFNDMKKHGFFNIENKIDTYLMEEKN